MVARAAKDKSGGQPIFGLDDLAAKKFSDLESLYRMGRVPASLHELDGPLKGRMLAVRELERPPFVGMLRRWAASSSFVWDGKSFTAESDEAGSGINRVHLPGILGDQTLFPFRTHIGESVVDGQEAVILDYDLAENPIYIRRIHDEVREVSPGVYLGPAMWKGAKGPTTVLWFALDTGNRE